jgi:tRNA pseudouridine38-40 synthase
MTADDESTAAAQHGICLTVAYDGTRFHGFQRQPGQRTVQGELERAIAEMTGHEVRVRGAGRTDAGVHALGQVVAFDTTRAIPELGFRRGLAQKLPDDLRVQAARRVAPGYNPRFDAVGKTYRYVLSLGEPQNPLFRFHTWHLGKQSDLDLLAMRRAARALEGTHDYRAFRAADDERENTIRTIFAIDVVERFMDQPSFLAIEVRGTAFMKNMVRILVGTLIQVGRHKLGPSDMPKLLGPTASRAQAGPTAPAQGLVLVQVALGRLGSDAQALPD